MNNEQEPTPTPQASPSPLQPKKLSKGALAAIIAGAVLVLALIIGGVVWAITTYAPKDNNTTTESNLTEDTNAKSDNATQNTSPTDKKARDSERRIDIDALRLQLEVYYAVRGGYPAVSDINDSSWRTANEFKSGTEDKTLADPLTPDVKSLSSVVPTTTTGSYTYIPTPVNCKSMTNAAAQETTPSTSCTGYRLVALLEDKDASFKDPSSTDTQTFYIQKSE